MMEDTISRLLAVVIIRNAKLTSDTLNQGTFPLSVINCSRNYRTFSQKITVDRPLLSAETANFVSSGKSSFNELNRM